MRFISCTRIGARGHFLSERPHLIAFLLLHPDPGVFPLLHPNPDAFPFLHPNEGAFPVPHPNPGAIPSVHLDLVAFPHPAPQFSSISTCCTLTALYFPSGPCDPGTFPITAPQLHHISCCILIEVHFPLVHWDPGAFPLCSPPSRCLSPPSPPWSCSIFPFPLCTPIPVLFPPPSPLSPWELLHLPLEHPKTFGAFWVLGSARSWLKGVFPPPWFRSDN